MQCFIGGVHYIKKNNEASTTVYSLTLGETYYNVAIGLSRIQCARDDEGPILSINQDKNTDNSNLGLVYQNMGDLEQAKDYHQQALEIQMRELGPNHADVCASYNNLGTLYQGMGELELAKDYHQRVLKIRIKAIDQTHFDVGTSYDNLGGVCKDMGDLEES